MRFALLFAALLLGAVSPCRGQTWDLADEFSVLNGNPNGAWTYGWRDSSGVFSPYTAHRTFYLGGEGWVGPLPGTDPTPQIWLNTTSSVLYGVVPGDVSLHPGPSGEASMVRWTASPNNTGLATVVGAFYPGDGGAMTVAVFKNGVWGNPLWLKQDSGFFNLAVDVVPGDTIDFGVFGSYYYGNTPLDVTITAPTSTVATPEASGIAIWLALGVTMFWALRRRCSQ